MNWVLRHTVHMLKETEIRQKLYGRVDYTHTSQKIMLIIPNNFTLNHYCWAFINLHLYAIIKPLPRHSPRVYLPATIHHNPFPGLVICCLCDLAKRIEGRGYGWFMYESEWRSIHAVSKLYSNVCATHHIPIQ